MLSNNTHAATSRKPEPSDIRVEVVERVAALFRELEVPMRVSKSWHQGPASYRDDFGFSHDGIEELHEVGFELLGGTRFSLVIRAVSDSCPEPWGGCTGARESYTSRTTRGEFILAERTASDPQEAEVLLVEQIRSYHREY